MRGEILPLMRHQELGVEFARDRDVVALLMDRGSGKTPTALASLSEKMKRGIVGRILYVAPLSTLKNIAREAHRFTDNLVPQVIHGSRAERERMLLRPGRNNLDVVNYDALRILPKLFMEAGYDAMVLDESTRVKDRKTRTTTVTTSLSPMIRTKYLLTGMPFTEGVEDAWSQFNILDPGILGSNYYSFRNRYCVLSTGFVHSGGRRRKYHKIAGYRRLDDFESRVRPYVYRVAKEDCLDLPDKTFQRLEIDMLDAQRRAYLRVENAVATEIGERRVSHAVALSKLQKLRQVAAGFMYDVDHEPVAIPTRKYEELKELLSESLYGSQKAVVFTSFRAEPEMVARAVRGLKRETAVFLIPDDPAGRQDLIDQWTAHRSSPAVLVANVRSGGTGLNLTAAHMAVFMSNDWRMEDRAQAEDRIHRIGSEIHGKITIIDIVTRNTIEEDVLAALKSKRDLVDCFLERLKRRGDP